VKKIIISIMFFSFLKADIIKDFLSKNYEKICTYKTIDMYMKDDKALSIIGLSCLKLDKLYMLPYVFNKLKRTKKGRKNGIYFLTIYTQKKLLYSYLFDNLSLDAFSLPETDYILSKVFWAIKLKDYKKEKDKFVIIIDEKRVYVYKKEDKFFVDEYKENKLIKRHWYR